MNLGCVHSKRASGLDKACGEAKLISLIHLWSLPFSMNDDFENSNPVLAYDPPPAGYDASMLRKAPPPRMLDHQRIARAVRLIERTPATSTTLKDVSAHFGLSPFHFQRQFQEVMGESPSAYMRRTRLDRAAMNLQMSAQPITHIAFNAGYASHEAFIRAFQRQFGATPSDYRVAAQKVLPERPPPRKADLARVKVGRRPEMRLLAMRFYGSYALVEENWRKFGEYLKRVGFPMGQARPVGIILDTPLITPGELVRYDCAVVDQGFPVEDTALSPLQLRAGRYVSTNHAGLYAEIFRAYEFVSIDWITTSGEIFLPDGNGGYEFYNLPPWDHTGRMQNLDIVLPLAG
jgi:AraC family transcriptional regulator